MFWCSFLLLHLFIPREYSWKSTWVQIDLNRLPSLQLSTSPWFLPCALCELLAWGSPCPGVGERKKQTTFCEGELHFLWQEVCPSLNKVGGTVLGVSEGAERSYGVELLQCCGLSLWFWPSGDKTCLELLVPSMMEMRSALVSPSTPIMSLTSLETSVVFRTKENYLISTRVGMWPCSPELPLLHSCRSPRR